MYIFWSFVVVAIFILYCIARKRDRTAFWNIVKRDPSRYYRIFLAHPDIWIVGEKAPGDHRQTNWPFYLHVPEIGKIVPIYGVLGKYRKHRRKLVKQYERETREEE